MSDKQVEVNLGGGFLGILCLIFITLKLTGIIGWSWWWVLAPLWVPISLGLLGLLIFGIVTLVIVCIVMILQSLNK